MVIYDNISMFSLAPVEDISRIGLVVRNNREMKVAVEKVLTNHGSLVVLRAAGKREVDHVFSYLDGTAAHRFVQFLQNDESNAEKISEGKTSSAC